MKLVQSSTCWSILNYFIFGTMIPSICALVPMLMLRISIALRIIALTAGILASLILYIEFIRYDSVDLYTGSFFVIQDFSSNFESLFQSQFFILYYICSCVQFYQNHSLGRRVNENSSYEFHLKSRLLFSYLRCCLEYFKLFHHMFDLKILRYLFPFLNYL